MRRTSAALALAAAVAALACQKAKAPATVPEAPQRVREPAQAGRFYPEDAKELMAEVEGFMARARRVTKAPARMVLAPHAGLVYSGQLAAEAIRQLAPGFERAVIVAANHSGEADYAGVSPDKATHYRMPGLEVKVAAATAGLLGRPGFVDVPAAHGAHMVEIELPFLHVANGGRPFELVPLVVGQLDRAEARSLASELAGLADEKTVFVFSVDLSHYHPYEEANALDTPCLDAIARADADDLAARCDTDGDQVLMTMLELGARLGLTPRLLGYRNSGDVSGDKERVVGYGALAWEDRFELLAEEQRALVSLARSALEARVREGRELALPTELASRYPRLLAQRGAFVTLKKGGELRGCVGSLQANQPLAQDVIDNAINAALHDSRFEPVEPEELPQLHVSISVLETPRAWAGVSGDAVAAKLGETKPGLILHYRQRRSTFLPEVWEQLPEPVRFLDQLCLKQGSPTGCWRSAEARFETYGSQHFGEP